MSFNVQFNCYYSGISQTLHILEAAACSLYRYTVPLLCIYWFVLFVLLFKLIKHVIYKTV